MKKVRYKKKKEGRGKRKLLFVLANETFSSIWLQRNYICPHISSSTETILFPLLKLEREAIEHVLVRRGRGIGDLQLRRGQLSELRLRDERNLGLLRPAQGKQKRECSTFVNADL
jgi:hypothetical protein